MVKDNRSNATSTLGEDLFEQQFRLSTLSTAITAVVCAVKRYRDLGADSQRGKRHSMQLAS